MTTFYSFGSNKIESDKIISKMFQSSTDLIVSTSTTFTSAGGLNGSSYYYYKTLQITSSATLTLASGIIIYCKYFIIDTGSTVKVSTVSIVSSGATGGTGNKDAQFGGGGGGGGYGTAGSGGNSFGTPGYGGGGSAYNYLSSSSEDMLKNNYSTGGPYVGSYGASGGGAGAFNQSTSAGGGGAGGGFVKIFAWESTINGVLSVQGDGGGSGTTSMWGSYMDNEVSAGSGGGGSGGTIEIVSGSITASANGKIDIRGGAGGVTSQQLVGGLLKGGNGGGGGAGGWGRAYVWSAASSLSLVNNFNSAPSTVAVLDTANLVSISSTDTSPPVGNMSLYSKTPAFSLYNADNETIFGVQSLIKTLRPKEWFTIAHSLNEFDSNYVAKIQKDSLTPVTLSSFSTYTKLGALKALTKVLVTSNSTTGLLLETTLPYNTTVNEPSNVTLGSNAASTFGGLFAGSSNSAVIVNSIQYNPMTYANSVNQSIIHIVQTNTPYRLYSWYMSGSNLVTSLSTLLGTPAGSAIVGDSGHTVASMVIDPAGNNIFILYNRGVGVLGTTVNYIRSMKFKGWINGSDYGYTHNSHAAYATGASVVVGATTAITAGGGYPVAPGANFSIARCMAIHPSGSYLYVASCATSSDFGKTTVQRFSVNQTTGLITLLSDSAELVNNTLIGTYPVSMLCDPTGKWLYVSCSSTYDGTRSGSLAAYLVQNGTIVAKEETIFSETGKPSCFAFDLTGSFIHLGYGTGTSNWIRTFKINQSTGALTEVLPVASTDYTYGSLKRILVDPTSGNGNAFIYVIGNNSSSSNLYVTCFSRNTTTGEVKFVNKSFFDFAANTNGGDTTMDIEPRRKTTDTAAGLFPRILAGTTLNLRNSNSSFRLYTQSGSDPYYQQEYNEEKYAFESNVSGLVKVWPAIQAPSGGSLTVNFSSSDYSGNSGDNTSPLTLNIIPFTGPLSF